MKFQMNFQITTCYLLSIKFLVNEWIRISQIRTSHFARDKEKAREREHRDALTIDIL